MNSWISRDVKLLYVGDGYPREAVEIVRQADGVNIVRREGLQVFRWPDGSEHAGPWHTVVKDTSGVRRKLGLAAEPETR